MILISDTLFYPNFDPTSYGRLNGLEIENKV